MKESEVLWFGWPSTQREYEYEYDAAGNVIKMGEYADGSLRGWTEYEYDGDGNRVKTTAFDEEGNVEESSSFTTQYDSQGNPTVDLYESGKERRYENTYDEQNRFLQVWYYTNDTLEYVEEYFWDGQ